VSHVTVGYLGWSNARNGLEFYVGNQGNARWLPRARPGVVPTEGEKGALLQDELEENGCYEGTSVVVVALPGRLPEALANHLAARIALNLDDLIAQAEETAQAVEP
jgi:hypothetical protein